MPKRERCGRSGEEGAAEIFNSFDIVDEQHSATFAYRSDLSYVPVMSDGN